MHGARIRLAAGAALTAAFAFGFVGAPAAHAAITGSLITTPADPSFYVAAEDASTQTFALSGTAAGGHAGDFVDVRCYFGGSSVLVAKNVPLTSSGTFSRPAAKLSPVLQLTCRLRAVPAGTSPADPTAFSGPVIAVGERATSKVSGGPNDKKAYDYHFDAQQKTAAFDYASLGKCGADDGYLYDSTMANTTITFACNAALLGGESGAQPTRSELQIDGTNAYASATAYLINPTAKGLPTVTTTYVLDAATGNVVVRETDPLVKCPTATYPPKASSCSSFVATGVTDNRTITQDHDGHISWIADAFTSTDGKSHSLDLLWDNSQRFWGPSGNATQLEYEFPGQSVLAKHVLGDAVSSQATPGTILVRMGGAPDGDVATGQGAIVYDRPSTGAKFTYVQATRSTFTLHQTGTVPASGSTRFRFAYVQDYHAATVTSLARAARTAFLNTVAVARSGKGKGRVTSSPGGISCAKACSHGFGYGTSVTLRAKPAKGSRFLRWTGACTGTRKCTIVVTDNVRVGAVFALRLCAVPNVMGKTLKAATLAIKRRFCSVGSVRTVTSTVARGRVISQKPTRGKKLKPHARVDLVVSSG